jgi:hypothetical protein
MILLISAFWVARIIGMSHWLLAQNYPIWCCYGGLYDVYFQTSVCLCATQRVHCNVNCRLWLITQYQCWLINCNKCYRQCKEPTILSV